MKLEVPRDLTREQARIALTLARARHRRPNRVLPGDEPKHFSLRSLVKIAEVV